MADVRFDLSVIGDKKLQKKLNRLAGNQQKKIIRRALREGAKEIAERSRQLVPVDTGALRASIKVRADKFKGPRPHPIGVIVVAGAGLGGRASFTELGTEHQAAQPFLRRSADQLRRRTIDRIGEGISDGIERMRTR